MKAILRRFADSPDGVFGYLDLYNHAGAHIKRFCVAEEDWLENQPRISCIPIGAYICKRSVWHKTGAETFEITGVPGRSRVLFHWGNTEEDTEACFILGTDFGAVSVRDEDLAGHPVRLKWAIAAGTSRPAFKEFMELLAGVGEFELTVEWAKPGSWRVAA
jgi:hypothetical protein